MWVVSIAHKVSMNVISANRLSIMDTPAAARGAGERRGVRGGLETEGRARPKLKHLWRPD